MTQEQELAILKPWALTHELEAHPNSFDMVIPYTTYKGVNVYKLWNTSWNVHHKMGYHKLVIVENGMPVRLSLEEVFAVNDFVLSSLRNKV